jgi:hypothetical protein
VYVLELTYRRSGPVSLVAPILDTQKIARTVLSELVAAGNNPSSERTFLWVWAQTPTPSFTTIPQATLLQRRDYSVLLTSGMTPQQYPAVFAVSNRQARISVVMRRTPRHPSSANFPTAKCAGDYFGSHRQPLSGLEDFVRIAGRRSTHFRKSSASTRVRRPRLTALSSPDLIAS